MVRPHTSKVSVAGAVEGEADRQPAPASGERRCRCWRGRSAPLIPRLRASGSRRLSPARRAQASFDGRADPPVNLVVHLEGAGTVVMTPYILQPPHCAEG